MILVWQPDKWNFVCVCVDHCGTLLVSRSSRCWPMTSHDHICTLGPFGQSGCSDSGHVRSRCGQAYWGESALSPLWNDYEDQMIKDRYEGLWRHCFFRTKGSKLRMKHGKARRIPVRLRVSESCVSFCAILALLVCFGGAHWASLLEHGPSYWVGEWRWPCSSQEETWHQRKNDVGMGENPLLPYVLGNKHLLTRLTSYFRVPRLWLRLIPMGMLSSLILFTFHKYRNFWCFPGSEGATRFFPASREVIRYSCQL